MTREEIIRNLKYTMEKHKNDTVNTFDTNISVMCKDILEYLEQEPKTVLYSGDGYADGYMVYDMAECPNCGYEYEYGDKDWGLSYCPNCGQKMNWERSDKE